MKNWRINLNLATIVHRLLASPRGCHVASLQSELGIAPRTYRKYRQLLRDDFQPFIRRDGRTAIFEVVEDDERFLRLRPLRELGATSPDFDVMTAALHLATSMLFQTGDAELTRGAHCIMSEYHASLKDPDFTRQYALREVSRMFLAERRPCRPTPALAEMIRGIANRQRLRVQIGGYERVIEPLSLILRQEGFVLAARDGDAAIEVDAATVEAAELLDEAFEYPSALRYQPNKRGY